MRPDYPYDFADSGGVVDRSVVFRVVVRALLSRYRFCFPLTGQTDLKREISGSAWPMRARRITLDLARKEGFIVTMRLLMEP